MAGYVNLSSMPSPKKEYVVSFENLSGGLNLQELDYRIGNNETPEMKNLLWREGVLACRDGQVWVNGEQNLALHKAYNGLWNEKMFVHAGTKIYMVDPENGTFTGIYTGDTDFVNRGTFFLYGENLYYKTKGYYIEIKYSSGTFTAANVSGYVPVTYINCNPDNGSGTVYQPENRISSEKTLWYNSGYTLTNTVNGNLSVSIEDSYFRFRINTPGTYVFEYTSSLWVLDDVAVDPLDFGIRIGGTPQEGDSITVVLAFKDHYYLPLQDTDVTKVVVEGTVLVKERINLGSYRALFVPSIDADVWRTVITESNYDYRFTYDADNDQWSFNGNVVVLADYGLSYTCPSALTSHDFIKVDYLRGGYWVDEDEGFVGFIDAPTCYYPEINNTVQITYSKDNDTAMANIMDCEYTEVYGGTGSLCVVMAGSTTQPNAYFWNGQTDIAMDPTYFPMTQYQLAGDGVDPITGFGKQQGYLIIFKDHSVGRTSLSTETVEGRLAIDLPYTAINAKIGCDLPYTIQLIENNLVWCNKDNGVHFLANTSSAYENNIECISIKVNESSQPWTKGLLYDVRNSDIVTSHDDEKRYWLIADGNVWLWDYNISNYKKPAWFYYDNIPGIDFIQEYDDIWHFDSQARLTKFVRAYYDYDPVDKSGGIEKVFRFASQYFGTYDNLKNVNSVIINMRSDTNSLVSLEYITDYEVRKDLESLQSMAWLLVPRNLSFRVLRGSGFSHVFRRKPHCRRVHYFTMRLKNDDPTMDMSVVSAQIYYTYQGRFR